MSKRNQPRRKKISSQGITDRTAEPAASTPKGPGDDGAHLKEAEAGKPPVEPRTSPEVLDDKTLAGLDDQALYGLLERFNCDVRSREGAITRILAVIAERCHAAYQAGLAAGKLPESPATSVARHPLNQAEVRVAKSLRLAPRAARHRLTEAATFARRQPRTLRQLQAAQISAAQAFALHRATSRIAARIGADPLDTARRIENALLPQMPRENIQATLKALNRALLNLDPEGSEQRHREAVRNRSLTVYKKPEGMATIRLTTTAALANQLYQRINELARPRSIDERRTIAQRRADALTDLILSERACPSDQTPMSLTSPDGPRSSRRGFSQGSLSSAADPGSPPVRLLLTMTLDALIGLAADPGELAGYGPIAAATARRLANMPGSLWQWLVTDPATGTVIMTSATLYRPDHQDVQ